MVVKEMRGRKEQNIKEKIEKGKGKKKSKKMVVKEMRGRKEEKQLRRDKERSRKKKMRKGDIERG